MRENTIDPGLREWVMSKFSATTQNDRVIASVFFMGAMKSYFSYGGRTGCGLPSTTLIGEKKDWEVIFAKLEEITALGEEATEWRITSGIFGNESFITNMVFERTRPLHWMADRILVLERQREMCGQILLQKRPPRTWKGGPRRKYTSYQRYFVPPNHGKGHHSRLGRCRYSNQRYFSRARHLPRQDVCGQRGYVFRKQRQPRNCS